MVARDQGELIIYIEGSDHVCYVKVETYKRLRSVTRKFTCSMELLGFCYFCNKVYLNLQAPVSEKYLIQYFHDRIRRYCNYSDIVLGKTQRIEREKEGVRERERGGGEEREVGCYVMRM